MIKLGITGGIGSGKSVVSKLLGIMGVPVYVADDEAKRITMTSSVIQKELVKNFGADLFSENHLNKEMLASLIFNNPKNLKLVNSIIHPEVLADFLSWTENLSDKPVVAIETAILFESGFDHYVDVSVNVSAPKELQIERVQERDQTTPEVVLSRISNQFSDEYKCSLADEVIVNDGRQAIIPQVENLMRKLYC